MADPAGRVARRGGSLLLLSLVVGLLTLAAGPTTHPGAAVPLPAPLQLNSGLPALQHPSATIGHEPSQWREVAPAGRTLPVARAGASAAFDPNLGAVLVFGGQSAEGRSLGDLWTFSHGTWSPSGTGGHLPSPRWGAAMAFDPATGRTVLFGGTNGTTLYGDTWVFNGSGWRLLPSVLSPSPRSGAALTYDPALGGLVLFGGQGPGAASSNDTWLYASGGWTNLTSQFQTPAPAVGGPSLAFDPAGAGLVLMGAPAADGPTGAAAGGWELSATGWAPYVPSSGPAPTDRGGATLVAAPSSDDIALFGGATGGSSPPSALWSDTWTYAGGSWANGSGSAGPTARSGAAAAFDPDVGGMFLFGGRGAGGSPLGDAWTFAPIPVTLTLTASPTAGPAPLNVTFQVEIHGGTPPYSSGWAFGDGATATGGPNQTHSYPVVGTYSAQLIIDDSAGSIASASVPIEVLTPWQAEHQWGELSVPASRAPSPRWSSQAAFDPSIAAGLLFGGQLAGGAPTADTWEFANGVWINLTSHLNASPPARWGGAFAFDPSSGSMVLFGGTNGVLAFNDTWTFSPAVGWQLVPATPSPSGRELATLTDDPALGADLLFGGGVRGAAGGWTIYNDTWEWQAGIWTNLTASLVRGPPPTLGAAASFDSATREVLMFGGSALPPGGTPGTCYPDAELWVFSAGQWSLSPVGNPPSERLLSTAAFLPADGTAILFGGAEAVSGVCHAGADTWSYDNGTWSNLSAGIAVTPPARSAAAGMFDAGAGAFLLFGGDQNGVALNDTWIYPALLNQSQTVVTQQTVSTPSGNLNQGGANGSGSPGGSGSGPFTVGYTISGGYGHAPDSVTFSATETGGVPPFQVSWYFGDSSPSVLGATVTHAYQNAGNYEAVLTVVDFTGQSQVELIGPIVVLPPAPTLVTPTLLPSGGGGAGWVFPALGAAAIAVVAVAVFVEYRHRRLQEEGNALVREIEQSKNP